ncbi:hypothetical protein T492DRAFT_868112 [Pavlovales sp. CCMP2436]|nr:hypothetical protein T492DRAFT_868112 [Pavlovales sp. CCMP2436]
MDKKGRTPIAVAGELAGHSSTVAWGWRAASTSGSGGATEAREQPVAAEEEGVEAGSLLGEPAAQPPAAAPLRPSRFPSFGKKAPSFGKMDAFLGKVSSSVSSISDSIGEKSVRALGDMMASPTFTSPSQSETRSRYDDEEVGGDGGGLSGARKTRGSGDGFRSYDDAGGSGANSSWMPSAASAGGWLNRLGGAPNSEEAKDREPLVGRSPREANTEAAGGAGGVGASQSFSGGIGLG